MVETLNKEAVDIKADQKTDSSLSAAEITFVNAINAIANHHAQQVPIFVDGVRIMTDPYHALDISLEQDHGLEVEFHKALGIDQS